MRGSKPRTCSCGLRYRYVEGETPQAECPLCYQAAIKRAMLAVEAKLSEAAKTIETGPQSVNETAQDAPGSTQRPGVMV